MKNTTRSFLFSLVGLVIVSVVQAGVPAMEVTVQNASNKDVYKGMTDANGNFATGDLAAGNYVIQIYSKNSAVKGSKFDITASAGKASSSANAVAGQQIAGDGVAMRLAVTGHAKITGRISAAGTGTQKAASTSTASNPEQKTKMINGKKFIWVPSDPHTLQGARWVEEGTEPAASSTNVKSSNPPPRPMSGGRY